MRDNAGVVPIDPLLARPRAEVAEPSLDGLYRRHHRRLRGLAASVMLDWSQADEVVHDAFAGLAARSGDIDKPEGYLRRSVINLAVRVVKRRGRTLPARPIEPPSIPEIDEMWTKVADLLRANAPYSRCASGRTSPRSRSPTCSTSRWG